MTSKEYRRGPNRLSPFSEKWCPTCQQYKSTNDFGIARSRFDGLTWQCSDCKNKASRAYKRQYRKEYMEEIKARDKKEYEQRKAYYRQYHKTSKWREYQNEWRRRNAKHRISRNRAQCERRQDVRIYLSARLSNAIYKSITRNKAGRIWESLVGYTLDDLRAHLEARFQSGMSWDNYGRWHIDHIIPVALWKFETPEDPEFGQCWALANLQPLWREENLRKGDRTAA